MKFAFYDVYLKAFECLKENLISTRITLSLDWTLPFEMIYDASGVALGVVLGQ